MVMALHALLSLRALFFPPSLSVFLSVSVSRQANTSCPPTSPFLCKKEEDAAYRSENVVDLAVRDITRHMFGCKSVVY